MAVLLIFGTLAACGKSDDETAAIRLLIDEGAELAEKQQIGDLVRLGTEDFVATPGTHDANSVKGILFVAFRRYGRFSIHYPRPTVELDPEGKQATASVYFVIVSKERNLPDLRDLYNDPVQWLEAAREKADPYLLQLELIQQDRRWQVQRAHIESAMRRLMSDAGPCAEGSLRGYAPEGVGGSGSDALLFRPEA
ncbi:hypothetical protein [Desulfatitalea alkaliphila]|uniref:Uncharacterized protein n=1 Tax=Desulfatitalea alkaliphila TaxID=2929485 RepID=A0AA41QZD8_9BACT|nr:hypothetical protein [Desulfatitalea alkaliphila]MCJ8499044.1 hypothetical protein [Desulfatitalea alkaliphila]